MLLSKQKKIKAHHASCGLAPQMACFWACFPTHPPCAWFALQCVQTARKRRAKSPLQWIVLAV